MSKKQCPKVGERFTLTLKANEANNTPLGIVKEWGYSKRGWKHRGEVLTGEQTKEFMLVEVGYQSNIDAVKRAIEMLYGIPPKQHKGQWKQAYLAEYEPNSTNHIGIADNSWVTPDGNHVFPCLLADGRSRFSWSGHDFDKEEWLWLVPAP